MSDKKHIVWLDMMRLVAMFTMVCCHCADPFNFYPGEAPANIDEIKFWGAAYGAFLRPCVPLFAMITGVLLLHLCAVTHPPSTRKESAACSGRSSSGASFMPCSRGSRGIGMPSGSDARLLPLQR